MGDMSVLFTYGVPQTLSVRDRGSQSKWTTGKRPIKIVPNTFCALTRQGRCTGLSDTTLLLQLLCCYAEYLSLNPYSVNCKKLEIGWIIRVCMHVLLQSEHHLHWQEWHGGTDQRQGWGQCHVSGTSTQHWNRRYLHNFMVFYIVFLFLFPPPPHSLI